MKTFPSKWRGICNGCKDAFAAGTEIAYDAVDRKAYHPGCFPQELVDEPDGMNPKTGKFSSATDGYKKDVAPGDLADQLGFGK